jgi:predicted O-linked N-acetylglucosamine transferase (SPINDLY family)
MSTSAIESLLRRGLHHLDTLREPSVAAGEFRRVVELEPRHLEATYNLGKALFALGDAEGAVARWQEAHRLATAAGRQEEAGLCLKSIAVAIPGSAAADNAAILAARKHWAGTMHIPKQARPVFQNRDRSPDRPLVVGYVSSFFDRENWMKPVWALLNRHDRGQFQVRVFSFGPVPGGQTPGAGVETAWRPDDSDRIFDVAALNNGAVAKVIADEHVDILVDLNGYSDMARLPLYLARPAPVIVGWFNLYATTGSPCFDWLIGDEHVVQPGEEAHYSERIARVDGSYLTFEVGYRVPDVAPPPCLSAGRVTFGSLCSRYKLTPEVIGAWSEVLRRAPAGRLLIRNAGLESAAEREHLLEEFRRRGAGPERLDLLGRAPHREFLETYSRIDIALDTFPYNGGTTTTEAIWQGVPVTAFAGRTWASRTSATLLREGGLGEWVADDMQQYVELAAKWGNDPAAGERLAVLRRTMRARLGASSVCDVDSFARSMVTLYRRFWREWAAG